MGQGNSAPRVSGGVPWWLWGVALLATAAVLLGVLSAMVQANAYGESRSEAIEQRYVATIHPVLRSESEGHSHPESP